VSDRSSISIEREDAASLDGLQALVCELKAHHAALAPELGAVRGDGDFWELKRAQYRLELDEHGAALFVARDGDGAPVGFAFAAPVSPSERKTWIQPAVRLHDIVVSDDARGAGVGAMLLDTVRTYADGRELRLSVLWANEGARRFYERTGFVEHIVDLALPAEPRGVPPS